MSSQPEPLPLPSFTNEISKELWLFWYSNDPPEKLSINTSHLGIHFLSCYFRILLLAMLPFFGGDSCYHYLLPNSASFFYQLSKVVVPEANY